MHCFRPTALAAPALTASALLSPASAPRPSDVHGIAVQNMEPSVKPGNDFHLYANGAFGNCREPPRAAP